MKSMQVTEFGQPLVQADTPTPVPRGREVLLRVRAAGVCHTDLHLWHGGYDLGHGRTLSLKERGVTLPLTMGHETVGIVEAVGEDAGEVPLGAVRLVYPWIGCGQCEVCREGRENLCLTPRTIGINRAGGYADYILVPDPRHLVDLQGLDPVRAAPLACSGLTCFSALRKIGEDVLRRGAIVVVGAGGLGLMSLQLLKAMGAPGWTRPSRTWRPPSWPACPACLSAANAPAKKSTGWPAACPPASTAWWRLAAARPSIPPRAWPASMPCPSWSVPAPPPAMRPPAVSSCAMTRAMPWPAWTNCGAIPMPWWSTPMSSCAPRRACSPPASAMP
jgi:hypothetical protein